MHGAYTENQQAKQRFQAVLGAPAAKPIVEIATSKHDITKLHGLLGLAAKTQQPAVKNKHIDIVQYGPKTLEGLFIEGNNNTQQAWALVTNQKGEFLIIPPNQILSFTAASISIKTKQGLKSLHLKKDEKGIDIRKVRKKQVANLDKKNGTKKPELSRAEKLRKKMLGK